MLCLKNKKIKFILRYVSDVRFLLLSNFQISNFPGLKNKNRIILRGILEIVGGFCVIVLPGFRSAEERDGAS